MGLNELGLLKDLAQIGKSAGTDMRKRASQPCAEHSENSVGGACKECSCLSFIT